MARLNKEDIAEKLGVSKSAVQRFIAKNNLKKAGTPSDR